MSVLKLLPIVLLGFLLGGLTVILLPWLFVIVLGDVMADAKDTIRCNGDDVTKDEPAPPPARDVRAMTLEDNPLPAVFEAWWQEQARKEK
jgi:hypothetical protein